MSAKNKEIVRLQKLVTKLEQELHDCTSEVLEIGTMARDLETRNESVDSIVIDVNDRCIDIYHKYDYRVKGQDAENLILDEV